MDTLALKEMGANEWRSSASLDKMNNGFLTLYLTNNKSGNFYSASAKKPSKKNYLSQEVDFADRQNSNNDYYPEPILRKEVDTSNGFLFISDPITEPTIINGSFIGHSFILFYWPCQLCNRHYKKKITNPKYD